MVKSWEISSSSRDVSMSKKPVVTRFAPSPTGYLHIGGGRTALFSYLFARHHAGKFLLRIEDTDAERHNEDAVTAIVKGMEWLGCKHDGDIVRQSSRKARHQEVAKTLITKNSAYYCYCSKDHLDELRKEAELKKEPFRYPGTCRPENLASNFVPPVGVSPVVRIRTTDDGFTSWDDHVQGTISFPNKDIDDLIILRADGSPTYLLAVVVDDHDMEVSHVIRGSDHISNTPRQIWIYKAAEWDLPEFAHIPLIHGHDGQKLSKRHGATGVEQYEALGYLPEAMRNYLSRLSWSHGNDEIFSTEQAIEWFDVKDCNRSPSCFDFDKLKDLNSHYIRQCDPDRLLSLVLKLYPDIESFKDKLAIAVDMLKPRAKTLIEYREAAEFIVAQRPLSLDDKAGKNIQSDAAKDVLRGVADLLNGYLGDWTAAALEPLVVGFTEQRKLKLGQVAQPLRAALTGTSASPGIYEVMWVLGKEECCARCLDVVESRIKILPPPPKEEKAVAAPAVACSAAAAAGAEAKAGGGKAAAKKGAAPAVPGGESAGEQTEWTKLEVKVGVLTKTWAHPESEKLFCEEIDVGEAAPRSVASGLRAHYTLEQFCPGRRVLVVTNLKPAKMAGFESSGMVLAAADGEAHARVELLEPPQDALPGERVFITGLTGEPWAPNQVNKKEVLKKVLPDLRTDGNCVACWKGQPILTSAGPIKVPSLANSPIG